MRAVNANIAQSARSACGYCYYQFLVWLVTVDYAPEPDTNRGQNRTETLCQLRTCPIKKAGAPDIYSYQKRSLNVKGLRQESATNFIASLPRRSTR
jgi:hypothetical protein